MVYQCLLEKDERLIWQIYLLKRRGGFISYERLQKEFSFTIKKFHGLCDWWTEIEEKKAVGICFIIQNTGIEIKIANYFCEARLWQHLLLESLTFQLLWQKLNDPLISITELSQQHYIARKTVWRRLETLQPLWENFNLRLDDNFQNCLMGMESQKRYLILQLKKMQLLSYEQKSYELLCFMQKVSEKRKNFGFNISAMETKILHSRAPQLAYQLDEKGWQFLLQQVLGAEIWLPKSYSKFLMALEKEPQLRSLLLADKKAIYRYHLCLQLFYGESWEEFFTPQTYLPETYLLQELSGIYVNKYSLFTRKHTNILNGYNFLLKKKLSTLELRKV